MSEFIKLVQMFSSLLVGNILAQWLVVIVMAFSLSYWKVPILRHPRYRVRFWIIATLALAQLLVFHFDGLSVKRPWPLVTVITLLILLGVLLFFAPRAPLLWSKVYLERLGRLADQGWSWNDENLCSKKPWYMMDFAEIYRFELIRAKDLRSRERYLEAWRIYGLLPEKKMLPREKEQWLLARATLAAVDLGDIQTAESLLKRVQNKDSLQYIIADSFITEVTGDIALAAAKLKRVLANPMEESCRVRASAFNQLGRMRHMEGNRLDAAYYYQKAVDEADKDVDTGVLHAAYQNLIGITLLQGNAGKAQEMLQEYASRLNFDIIMNTFEFANMKVQVARQIGDQQGIMETLAEGYDTLARKTQKANPEVRLSLNVSVLRSMHSAGIVSRKILDEVVADLDGYFELAMPGKYYALKEILFTLNLIGEGRPAHYEPLRSRLLAYMTNQARDEIEDYIARLSQEAVNERCALYSEKVGVIKTYELPYDFNRIYAVMKEIKEICREHSHFVDVMDWDLNILDEALYARRWDIMREHVYQAEASLHMLKNHPKMPESYLRLALYYFELQNKDKARTYLVRFEETGMSIWHYNNWLQEYYQVLKHELG